MRADIIVHVGSVSVEITGRTFDTRTEAYEYAWHLKYAIEGCGWRSDEVRSLALIPHPDYFYGPMEPETDRVLRRWRREALVNRVRDFIEGAVMALANLTGRSWPGFAMAHDYAFVRDFLRSTGNYAEIECCAIALDAIAEESKYLPRYQSLPGIGNEPSEFGVEAAITKDVDGLPVTSVRSQGVYGQVDRARLIAANLNLIEHGAPFVNAKIPTTDAAVAETAPTEPAPKPKRNKKKKGDGPELVT